MGGVNVFIQLGHSNQRISPTLIYLYLHCEFMTVEDTVEYSRRFRISGIDEIEMVDGREGLRLIVVARSRRNVGEWR